MSEAYRLFVEEQKLLGSHILSFSTVMQYLPKMWSAWKMFHTGIVFAVTAWITVSWLMPWGLQGMQSLSESWLQCCCSACVVQGVRALPLVTVGMTVSFVTVVFVVNSCFMNDLHRWIQAWIWTRKCLGISGWSIMIVLLAKNRTTTSTSSQGHTRNW